MAGNEKGSLMVGFQKATIAGITTFLVAGSALANTAPATPDAAAAQQAIQTRYEEGLERANKWMERGKELCLSQQGHQNVRGAREYLTGSTFYQQAHGIVVIERAKKTAGECLERVEKTHTRDVEAQERMRDLRLKHVTPPAGGKPKA